MRCVECAVVLATAVLSFGCTEPDEFAAVDETETAIPGFEPSSRATVEGRLLKLDGGMVGLLEARRLEDQPTMLHVELMLLQRSPSVPHSRRGEPMAAASQVWEVDCATGRHRTVGIVQYAQSGDVLRSQPISVTESPTAGTASLIQAVCSDSYTKIEVRRFGSLAEFLTLFEQAETSAVQFGPPVGSPTANPR